MDVIEIHVFSMIILSHPNCDVIGMTTVRLNVLGRHMYMAI